MKIKKHFNNRYFLFLLHLFTIFLFFDRKNWKLYLTTQWRCYSITTGVFFQLILVVIEKLLEWQRNYILLNQMSRDFNCIIFLTFRYLTNNSTWIITLSLLGLDFYDIFTTPTVFFFCFSILFGKFLMFEANKNQ